MATTESQAELAQRLVDNVNVHAEALISTGSRESAQNLMFDFIARGQDDGPDIEITPGLLRQLNPRQAMALDFGDWHFGELGRELLAFDSSIPVDWDNEHFQESVTSAAVVLRGLLSDPTKVGLVLSQSRS